MIDAKWKEELRIGVEQYKVIGNKKKLKPSVERVSKDIPEAAPAPLPVARPRKLTEKQRLMNEGKEEEKRRREEKRNKPPSRKRTKLNPDSQPQPVSQPPRSPLQSLQPSSSCTTPTITPSVKPVEGRGLRKVRRPTGKNQTLENQEN